MRIQKTQIRLRVGIAAYGKRLEFLHRHCIVAGLVSANARLQIGAGAQANQAGQTSQHE